MHRKNRQLGASEALEFDPCTLSYVAEWLNQEAAQKVLHVVPPNNSPLPFPWQYTSSAVFNNYDLHSMEFDVTLLYREFFEAGNATKDWRILIYSGMDDPEIVFHSTERWVSCLGRPVVAGWQPWVAEGQLQGVFIEYDRISLLGIRNSGHMVATTRQSKHSSSFSSGSTKKSFLEIACLSLLHYLIIYFWIRNQWPKPGAEIPADFIDSQVSNTSSPSQTLHVSSFTRSPEALTLLMTYFQVVGSILISSLPEESEMFFKMIQELDTYRLTLALSPPMMKFFFKLDAFSLNFFFFFCLLIR